MQSGSLSQRRQGSLKIMHRVWETSSAILNALSNKIRGMRVSAPQSAPRPVDSERRAQKALDSAKIQIRLLSNEGELASIRRIAEATEESEIASFAVSYIIEHELELAIPQLQHLASTFSHACLPALISLFNAGEADIAQSILMERLVNGDYFYLIQQKKARPLLLLDILGAVDEFNNSSLCYQYFPAVWRCIADRPEDQENLLAEILGDLNPGALRYAPDLNMIPQAVKIQALQLLHAIRPASYERSLWYGSRDQDDIVAHAATMACTEHWQSDGLVPAHLEIFPMLDLNLLFSLSKLASTFQWRGPGAVMAMYSEWNKEMSELETLDQHRD
ncbi:MAG: hypothetical protein K2X27_16685, partial [Candidatus Obscuribacterales bacterium]|nr:hypothetical protein [Candidatus Obscuribacterales bacterium]